MKRKFNVIAYQPTGHIVEVEAETEKEAMGVARSLYPTALAWGYDPGGYTFKIIGTEEIEEDE